MIASFLRLRSFRVTECGALSSVRETNCGVPQGAILSPTLFNLFVNDLPSSPQTQIFMFADDTAIAARSWSGDYAVRRIQTHLSSLEKWTVASKVTINASKSVLVDFGRRQKASVSKHLTFHSTRIPMDKSHKFLGIHFDNKLNWAKHVQHAIAKATVARRMLYPLLGSRSRVTRRDKITLYKAYIRPTLLYGCEIFGNCLKSDRKRLETFQNNILRYLTNQNNLTSITEIRNAHKVPMVHDFIQSQAARLKESLPRNTLTETLWDYPTHNKRYKSYRLPKEILFR
jgi:hypothetical protein